MSEHSGAGPAWNEAMRRASSGDRVVALGQYEGTHAETGREMVSHFAHVYEVRDGRIARFDQIADTWPMVAAERGL